MQPSHDYNDDYLLFLEVGFIAVNQSDEESALRLFRSCETLRPDNIMSKIGYGYVHLHKLELKQACQSFEAVLKQEPGNEIAKALLGLCISLQPKSTNEGTSILTETCHSENPYVQKMSTTALDFVDRFVRKEEPPIKGGKIIRDAASKTESHSPKKKRPHHGKGH